MNETLSEPSQSLGDDSPLPGSAATFCTKGAKKVDVSYDQHAPPIGGAKVDFKISLREIQRMVFVCNALNDGWTVRRVDHEKYEFIKDRESYERDISNHNLLGTGGAEGCSAPSQRGVDSTLESFLQQNMSIERLIRNRR